MFEVFTVQTVTKVPERKEITAVQLRSASVATVRFLFANLASMSAAGCRIELHATA
jgi:hypothetical protein